MELGQDERAAHKASLIGGVMADKSEITDISEELSDEPIDDEGYDLEDQRGDEEIILVRHQHPWVLAKAGLILIILTGAVVATFLVWKTALASWIVLSVAGLIIILYGFLRGFLYKNSVFVITNQRVINVYQGSLFNRIVQEVDLDNIYNMTYKIEGPMASLLNYGTIELTTEGDYTDCIKVKNIENPYFVHNKISEMRKRALKK